MTLVRAAGRHLSHSLQLGTSNNSLSLPARLVGIRCHLHDAVVAAVRQRDEPHLSTRHLHGHSILAARMTNDDTLPSFGSKKLPPALDDNTAADRWVAVRGYGGLCAAHGGSRRNRRLAPCSLL